jgi:hypothetical protein
MPMLIPFIPLIAAVAAPLLSKAIGGAGGGAKEAKAAPAQAAQAAAAKNLFAPEQITQAQDRYKQQGTAKWNQILSNMGAGGGTGGPDVTTQIGNQANSLGTALGQLNTDSGYGDQPMNNLDAILKGVEGGIAPKYAVY